jgi:alanine dehydrogenase
MRIGVVGNSLKENERRVPIYPEHLPWIAPDLRERLVFEENYGINYGYPDEYFAQKGSSLASRDELFEKCELLILPKPLPRDLERLQSNQIVFGWQHCVQQKSIVQAAIDNKLTLIAWEAMHHWSEKGEKLIHIFYKNNEVAGYAAVLHVLEILGIDGLYGPRRKVVILGYGSVSRGAIYALQGRGFNNIHVYSKRPIHLISDQHPDVYYKNIIVDKDGQIMARDYDGTLRPLIEELSDAEIICNGVLQDTDNPLMFITESQVSKLKPRTVIIDVSCDEGMSFYFAKPTSFKDPIFKVGENITYYSVDHTPAYLWNAASREISRALIPFLPQIIEGPISWEKNETIRRAIEIKDGLVINKKILSFQKRKDQYPHDYMV